jgi:hypothetical protein
MTEIYAKGKMALAEFGVSEWLSGSDLIIDDDEDMPDIGGIAMNHPEADHSLLTLDSEDELPVNGPVIPEAPSAQVMATLGAGGRIVTGSVALIVGLATSGKTTLANRLLDLGKSKILVHADDTLSWMTTSDNPGADITSEERVLRTELLLHIVEARPADMLVEGLWPNEHALLIEALDCPIILLEPPTFAEAQARWQERGDDVGDWLWTEEKWNQLVQDVLDAKLKYANRVAAGADLVKNLEGIGHVIGIKTDTSIELRVPESEEGENSTNSGNEEQEGTEYPVPDTEIEQFDVPESGTTSIEDEGDALPRRIA